MRIREVVIRAVAETNFDDGTSDIGITNALAMLGLVGASFDEPSSTEALVRVRGQLAMGWPTIICTQNLQHWVVIIGSIDNNQRFIVIDSARTKRNMAENGVRIFTEKELIKTWQTRKGMFFGVMISRKARKKNA